MRSFVCDSYDYMPEEVPEEEVPEASEREDQKDDERYAQRVVGEDDSSDSIDFTRDPEDVAREALREEEEREEKEGLPAAWNDDYRFV